MTPRFGTSQVSHLLSWLLYPLIFPSSSLCLPSLDLDQRYTETNAFSYCCFQIKANNGYTILVILGERRDTRRFSSIKRLVNKVQLLLRGTSEGTT